MSKVKKDKLKYKKAMQKENRKKNQLIRNSQGTIQVQEKKRTLGMREYALSELSNIIIRFRNENPRDFQDDIIKVATEIMEFAINPECKFNEFLQKNDLYDMPRNDSSVNTTERMLIKLEMSSIPYLFRQTRGNISDLQYGSIKVNFEFAHMILAKGLEEKLIDVLKEYVDCNDNLVTIEAVYQQGNGKYDVNKKVAQPNIQWVNTQKMSSLDNLYYEGFIYEGSTYLKEELQGKDVDNCNVRGEEVEIELPVVDLVNIEGFKGEKAFFLKCLKYGIRQFESFVFKPTHEWNFTEEEIESMASDINLFMKYFAVDDCFYRQCLLPEHMENNDVDRKFAEFLLDNWDQEFRNKEYYILNSVERAFILTITSTIEHYDLNGVPVSEYFPLFFNYLLMIYYSVLDGMKEYRITKRTCVVDKNDIPLACEYVYDMSQKVTVISDIKDLSDRIFRISWNEKVDWKQMYQGIDQNVKETRNILEEYDFQNNVCNVINDEAIQNLSKKINQVVEKDGLIHFESSEIDIQLVDDELFGLNYVQILEKGIQFKRLGRFNEAKECYIRAIKIEPRQANAYYNLGKVLYILNEFEASTRAYTMAFKNNICDIIRETYVSVDKFYVNLGHSILDPNAKQDDYSTINEYRILLNPLLGACANVYVNKDINKRSSYERKCIVAAKEFLDGQ